MKEMIQKLTSLQIAKIEEMLLWVESCNNDIFNSCKVEGLELFLDKKDNVYYSYLFKDNSTGYPKLSCEYYKITPSGDKINMKDLYESESQIVDKFTKLERVPLD